MTTNSRIKSLEKTITKLKGQNDVNSLIKLKGMFSGTTRKALATYIINVGLNQFSKLYDSLSDDEIIERHEQTITELQEIDVALSKLLRVSQIGQQWIDEDNQKKPKKFVLF